MKCKTCKFYDKINGHFCRRYAPRHISGVGTGFEDVLFPVVSPEDWCGEYVDKPWYKLGCKLISMEELEGN